MSEQNGGARRGHVLFAWSPSGYLLRERDGDPPAVGTELEDDGRELVVTRIGPSPLPGDQRRCAFTIGRA
jgi:hypothetical protein